MADSLTSGRIPELDGLRGIAISLVIALHYFYFDPYAGAHSSGAMHTLYVFLQRCIGMGWTGVDLFFVLSGFLIGGILLDVRGSPCYLKTFYTRRVYRILPLYYAWIVAYMVAIPAARSFMARGPEMSAAFSWHEFVPLTLFLQNFTVIGNTLVSAAWFQHTWSLAVEEQFYLIAPLLVRVLSRRALYIALTIAIISAPVLRLWVHFRFPADRGSLELAYTLMPCRADALALGILGALFWRNERVRKWLHNHAGALYATFTVFLAGFAALAKWFPSDHSTVMISVGFTWIATFYLLLILLALVRPADAIAAIARTRWLRELGRVSFCLYIIHLAVSFLLQTFLKTAIGKPGVTHIVACNAVAVICCYALASASWKYFEFPLLRRGHAYRY